MPILLIKFYSIKILKVTDQSRYFAAKVSWTTILGLLRQDRCLIKCLMIELKFKTMELWWRMRTVSPLNHVHIICIWPCYFFPKEYEYSENSEGERSLSPSRSNTYDDSRPSNYATGLNFRRNGDTSLGVSNHLFHRIWPDFSLLTVDLKT